MRRTRRELGRPERKGYNEEERGAGWRPHENKEGEKKKITKKEREWTPKSRKKT